MERLKIAVIGCGSAGPAAAIALARQGHQVEILEQVERLLPVGAGFLLQPTGLAVLERLGVLESILAHGETIDRLYCRTERGRVLLDLPYAELATGLRGVGLHRAVLLHYLVERARGCGVEVELGRSVQRLDELEDRDLIIVADGARSQLRDQIGSPVRAKPYPWGAMWFIGEDEGDRFGGELRQVVRGAKNMLGFLPTGVALDGKTPLVSLFWSVRADRVDQLRDTGLEAFKRRVLQLSPDAESVLRQIDDIDQLTFAGYHDVVMKPFYAGNAVVIGDAAHAMSPQLGQGVNLALCDADVLADCIDRAGSVAEALADYEATRRRHVAYYQLASRWLTPLFQSSSTALGWLRDVGFGVARHIGPLRRLMTRTMSGVERGFFRRSLPMPRLPD